MGRVYTLDVEDAPSLEAGTVVFTAGAASDGQTVGRDPEGLELGYGVYTLAGQSGIGNTLMGGSEAGQFGGQTNAVAAASAPFGGEAEMIFNTMLLEMDGRIDEITARTDRLLAHYA